MSTYFVPGAARHSAPGANAPAAAAAPAAYQGVAVDHRTLNPVRRRALELRYPTANPGTLDALAFYPEETADPMTLELLAQGTKGQTVRQLLWRRHPSLRPGRVPPRERPPLFRKPPRRVEVEDAGEGLPF